MKLIDLLEDREPSKSKINSWSDDRKLQYIKDDGLRITKLYNPTEDMWIEAVSQHGSLIRHNPNPTEAVQLAAIKDSPNSIQYIKNPTATVIKTILTDTLYITAYRVMYDEFVKDQFKDNTLLMNKWLRYAKNIREQS